MVPLKLLNRGAITKTEFNDDLLEIRQADTSLADDQKFILRLTVLSLLSLHLDNS